MSALGRQLVDLVLPPRCARCGAEVAGGAPGLCSDCFRGLRFISAPHCARCGLPFDYTIAMGPEDLCAGCLAHPPQLQRLRSVLVYDNASAPLIISFKHGDRTDLSGALARLMVGHLAAFPADSVLVPVPLHWRRLWARRYNQAALLAARLAAHGSFTWTADLVKRRRHTASQGGLDSTARRTNVRAAFAVSPGPAQKLRGRPVVLIDDVYTTGATLDACAQALLKAGFSDVFGLTLARAIKAV